MSFINISKVRSNKVYKVDHLLVVNSNRKSPMVNITMTPNNLADDLAKLITSVKTLPNAPIKLFYPSELVNQKTLKIRRNILVRNSFYTDFKSSGIMFNRIKELDSFKNKNLSKKPNYIDLSLYRTGYNGYSVDKKKNEISGYKFFKEFVIKQLERNYDSLNGNTTLYITLPRNMEEPFIKTLHYALTRKAKEVYGILNKFNIIFFANDTGYLYRPDLSTPANSAKVKTLLNKLFNAHIKTLNNGDVESDNDFEYVNDDTSSSLDKQSYADTAIYVYDDDDKDEEESLDDVDSQNIVKKQDSSEDDMFSKSDDDSSEKGNETDEVESRENDIEPERTVDVDSVENSMDLEDEDDEVLNLDEILSDSKSLDEISRKVSEENEKFLKDNLHFQVDALREFAAEANLLAEDKEIDLIKIEDDNIINDNWKNISHSGVTTGYYRKLFKKDILDIITSFNNDPEEPLVVMKFEMGDSSDVLNRKNELSIEFMDKRRKRHKFVVDVPILSNDGFLLLNGNKKFIARQMLVHPVVKEKIDSVLITTNYRKTFIYRKGDKINSPIDIILRLVADKSLNGIKKQIGNSFDSNLDFDVSIPYNFLANRLFSFSIDSGYDFRLSQKNMREELAKLKINVDYSKFIPIGFKRISDDKIDYIILEEINTRNIYKLSSFKNYSNKPEKIFNSIIDIINKSIELSKSEELQENFKRLKPSKSLSYSEIKIVSTSVALGPLIASFKGLLPALDAYDISYRVSSKREQPKPSEVMLKFKDTYLFIDTKFEAYKELFVNGLNFLETENYNIDDCIRMSPIFLDYFAFATGSRNTAKALVNFENSMIDPITKDVLIHFNLPIVFSDLLLYANKMLGSYTRFKKNDMSHYRVRDSECIAVAVYNSLTDSFNNYKRTLKSGMPQTINVRKDDVIKRVQSFINVEDFSTLSPFQEIEVKSKSTWKGASGLNNSDSYTLENKAYSKSMLGIFGMYSPISGEVGINRSMVANPSLDSVRGYISNIEDKSKLQSTQLFAMGELLNVFTPIHADAARVAMATVQGKHLTPTKVQDPYVVGSGADKALGYMVGQSFAFKALDNGVIEKIDTKKQLCTVRYKDGSMSAIDFSPVPAKNSGGGFYIENKLDLLPKIKVGYKVKKGEMLAMDNSFFKEMLDGSYGFATGRLTKMALFGQAETYEDSGIITDKMIDDMSSDVINERMVVLKKNTRISKVAKIGDSVEVNDALVEFEEVGDNEQMALSALEKLDSGSQDIINSIGKSIAKAKYTGEIFDIQIFYNVPLDDMDPTLASVVSAYNKKYDEKSKVLSGVRSDEIVRMNSTKMIESDKLFGQDVSGVVIKFYIKFNDKLKVGDKICFYTSLKTIVAETIPKGLEPYSEYRSNEDIDSILSPLSVVSRMTVDLFLMGYSNKVVLELEKQCLELLEE